MDVRGCLGTLHKESHSFYSNLFHSRALQLSISLSAGMGKRSGVLVPAKASDSKNLVCSGIVDLHTLKADDQHTETLGNLGVYFRGLLVRVQSDNAKAMT